MGVRRRTVLRVLGWGAVVLAGFAFTAWAWLTAGSGTEREDLEALLARHAAEGRGTTFEDYLVLQPVLDRPGAIDALDAYLAWSREPDPEGLPNGSSIELERAYMRGETIDASTRRWLALMAPSLEELERVLTPELPTVATGVWWQRRVARHGMPELPHLIDDADAGYAYALLEAAHAYLTLGLYDDPERATAGLDRLMGRLDPHGSSLDYSYAMSLRAIRDRAYVLLAWRGRLPTAARERWLGEAPPDAEPLARAIDADRVMIGIPMARALAAGDAWARDQIHGSGSGWIDRWLHQIYLEQDAAREAREGLELRAHVVDVLRGARPATEFAQLLPGDPGGGVLRASDVHILRFQLRRHVIGRTTHRRDRLAVRMMQGGRAPTDDELRGSVGDLPLVLEDLGDGAYRLGIAPDAEAHPLIGPAWTARASTRLGRELIPGGFSRLEGSLEWGPAPTK